MNLMEVSNKDMTKDLVTRIEQIEATSMTATDREMLQALNARLAVCDIQAMRLAELRELEREARGGHNEFLETEQQEPDLGPALHRSVSAPAPRHNVQESEHVGDIATTETVNAPIDHPRCSQAYYSDEDEYGHEDVDHDSTESVPDTSSWPAPYRILDISPDTPDTDIKDLVKKSIAALAIKHDPHCLPNDSDAADRWALIEKSRDVLLDVEKRRYLDRHGKVPVGLEDVDFSRLSL